MPEPRVLFLCTGNYYRSRYAEALFRHGAAKRNLRWTAFSRGLWRGTNSNAGPLSIHARRALEDRDIPIEERDPRKVDAEDFGAEIVIAVDEREHRPMVEAHHPAHAEKVEYWQVHDLAFTRPPVALHQIEQAVSALLDRLAVQRESVRANP